MTLSSKARLRRMASRAEHVLTRASELYTMAGDTRDEQLIALAGKALTAAHGLSVALDEKLK